GGILDAARAQAPKRAQRVERPQSFCRQAARVWARARAPGLLGLFDRGPLGVHVEEQGADIHCRDAVDHGVVDLVDHRHPAAFEKVDGTYVQGRVGPVAVEEPGVERGKRLVVRHASSVGAGHGPPDQIKLVLEDGRAMARPTRSNWSWRTGGPWRPYERRRS